MPPDVGEQAPDFATLLCDGETFRERELSAVCGDSGTVLVFDGFVFSAIAKNWWRRYERYGWHEFEDVPVYGVVRDGPYSINAFLRSIESPFSLFSDLEAGAARAFDILAERDGMGGLETPRRAVFVLDDEGVVAHRWIGDDWIRPVPHVDVEEAVSNL